MRALNVLRWTLVALIVLVLAAPALAVSVGGRLLVQVDGASMSPTYSIGDVLLVREPTRDDLKVGNVVTAIDGNGDYYTHRIETVNADGTVSLHGDGNAAADPGTVGLEQLRGVVELHFGQPWAFAIMQLQTWPLRICLLAVILGLALIPLTRNRTQTAPAGSAPAPTAPVAPSGPIDVATAPPATSVEAPAAAAAVPVVPTSVSAASRSELRKAEAGTRRARRPRGRRRAAPVVSRRGGPVVSDDVDVVAPLVRSTWMPPVATTITAPDPAVAANAPLTSAVVAAAPVPVEAATDPAFPVRTDPVLTSWAPRAASTERSADVIAARAVQQAIDEVSDADDVDAVDDVRNVAAESSVASPTSAYRISVIDGPQGETRVRISIDLDPADLSAVLASAHSGQVPPVQLAPVIELTTARSAARAHVTSGVTPPLEFAKGASVRPRDGRRRHGRRRAG